MPKRFIARLMVGEVNGLRSAVWRIWATNNDVYIAARGLGGILKISLHESGQRNSGFTSTYIKQLHGDKDFKNASRHFDKWTGGLELTPTLTLEYRINIPNNHLRYFEDFEFNAANIQCLSTPPDGYQGVITLLLDKKEVPIDMWPGKESMGTDLIARHQLPNGEYLWLLYIITENPENLHVQIEQIVQKMAKEFLPIKGGPSRFLPQHRILVGVKGDDGVRGYYDLAADNLNKYITP